MDIKDSAGESSKRSEKPYRENLNCLWESLNHHEQTVLEIWTLRTYANHTNALTQESFSLVGETEVRDSKHDRSMICNGQLKDGGFSQAEECEREWPLVSSPSERMETLTPQPQDLNSSASNQNELGREFFPSEPFMENSVQLVPWSYSTLRPQQMAQLKYIGHLAPGNWDNKLMLFTGGSLW